MRHDPLARNPFHVLAVAPSASRVEVERQGQKLLGLLDLGLQQAAQMATPLGPRPRLADDVRWALSELRDPDRRLAHELWAALSPSDVRPDPAPAPDPRLAPWTLAPDPSASLSLDLFALLSLVGAALGVEPAQAAMRALPPGTSDAGAHLAGAAVALSIALASPWLLWRLVTGWASPQVVHRLGTAAGRGGHDAPGLAALAAAQVGLARGGSGDDLAWIEQRLADSRPLRAAGLVASALLLERRGSPAGALDLLRSVEELRVPGAPAVAFRVARERRALEAAARGDWEGVAHVAGLPGARHTSRLTAFLGAAARRLLGRPDAPSDRRLRSLWWLAPRRLATASLRDRALAAAPAGAAAASDAASGPGPLPSGAWPAALARLAYARLGRPSAGELSALGQACDEALASAELASHIDRRARELGSSLGSRMLAELRDQVAEELAREAAAGDWPIGSLDAPGLTLERASRRLRDELLTELEAASEATRRRATEQRALPPVDEWRESLALRQGHERLARLAGPMARRLAWARVRSDLGKQAVWLWNIRGEKTIAHAIFRWLLDEATALDDQELMALQRKNVDCGF